MNAQSIVLLILRLWVASVWFWEGTWSKILWVNPHQLAIVESIGPIAGISPAIFLRLVGLGETCIGVALLLNFTPRLLASFQIFMLVTMNITALISAFTALENPYHLLENIPFLAAVAIVGFCQSRRPSQINWERGALGDGTGQARILFGQVREDADVEVSLLPKLTAGQRVFVIASGGCTAFAVASSTPAQVHSIDINSAQIALCKLKDRLMRTWSRSEYLALLDGDARSGLTQADGDFWRNKTSSLQRGLNHCGRVDSALRIMVRLFNWTLVSRSRVQALLSMNKSPEQRAHFHHYWQNWRWKLLFAVALNPRALSLFYGSRVLALLPTDFAVQMQIKVERFACAFPAIENPYLWQTFANRYSSSISETLPLYLRTAEFAKLQARTPIQFEIAEATAWLNQQTPGSLNYLCLSNIFESMDQETATPLWQAVERAAAPDAVIITRFIVRDSRVFLPTDSTLKYQDESSREATARDRSVICGNVCVFWKS